MSLPRFHCPGEIRPGVFELPAAAAHHAIRVVRLAQGDELVLFNGEGGEYRARVTRADKRSVLVEVLEQSGIDRESPLELTLVQALVSNEKMDWLLQKAVELGVSEIRPVETRRSVVRLAAERARKREQHWRAIAVSACEQCGRNRIPEVFPVEPVAGYLSRNNPGMKLLLSPTAASLRRIERPNGKVSLLIGPEGGLTEDEEQLAIRSGFQAVSLGPRILRTETAGLAAVSAIQSLWGDF